MYAVEDEIPEKTIKNIKDYRHQCARLCKERRINGRGLLQHVLLW